MADYIDPNSAIVSPSSSRASKSENLDERQEKLVKAIKDLFAIGKNARSKYDSDWKTRRDFYDGKQWPGELASIYKVRPTMNIIRSQIQAQLPILTDSRPGFTALPRDPSDFNFARAVTELIDYYWNAYQMDLTMVGVLLDEMIYDAGILKVSWDAMALDGVGEIRVDICDPNDIFVDPSASDFDKNCSWVLHRTWKPVSDLKRMFPHLREKIRSSGSQSKDNNRDSMSTEVYLVSPTDQWSPKGTNDAFATGNDSDLRSLSEVWEVWLDSEELENIELESGDKVTKKKYPRGKLVTFLPGQDLICQEISSPYEHGYKPFVRFVDTVLPREFWGEGESKMLMPTQRMINKTLSNMMTYFGIMSNPMWIIEEDSGVTSSKITNLVASVLTTKPGGLNKVKRDFAPALPPGIVDFYQLLMAQAEGATGLTEVSQGRRPPGVSAAAAIETLQEAAQTRIRLKERNMQNSLQQLGRQMVGLMLQYYREPRIVRITGMEDSQWPTYFEFFIEQGPAGGYVFNKKDYQVDRETGEYTESEGYQTTNETKGLLDIQVVAGTAMPWSKTSRANIAFRLYDAGAIDEEELLSAMEWPNAQEVLTRIKEKQAAAAEAEGGPSPEEMPPEQLPQG